MTCIPHSGVWEWVALRGMCLRERVRAECGYSPRYGIEVGTLTKKLDSLELRYAWSGGVSDPKP